MTDRVMLDIETLGLDPGAAILSIGAVRFGSDGLGDELRRDIDVRTCQEAGLTVDTETLDWHLTECQTFTDRTLTDGVDLKTALRDLHMFAETADEVWANSPKFDATMLERAASAVGCEMPWDFYELRDVRTVKNFPSVEEPAFEGTEHDPVDDARHQAKLVMGALQWIEYGDRDVAFDSRDGEKDIVTDGLSGGRDE